MVPHSFFKSNVHCRGYVILALPKKKEKKEREMNEENTKVGMAQSGVGGRNKKVSLRFG